MGFIALTLASSELFTENFMVPLTVVAAKQARVRDLGRGLPQIPVRGQVTVTQAGRVLNGRISWVCEISPVAVRVEVLSDVQQIAEWLPHVALRATEPAIEGAVRAGESRTADPLGRVPPVWRGRDVHTAR